MTDGLNGACCPRCYQAFDLLDADTLQMVRECQRERRTLPSCPQCQHWINIEQRAQALRPKALQYVGRTAMLELEELRGAAGEGAACFAAVIAERWQFHHLHLGGTRADTSVYAVIVNGEQQLVAGPVLADVFQQLPPSDLSMATIEARRPVVILVRGPCTKVMLS